MKSTTKRILSFAFLFLTLALVLYIGLRGNNPMDIWEALLSFSPLSLFLCFLCWFLYMFFEAMGMHYFIKKQGFKLNIFSTFKIIITGNYYSNITPASTGGQPMEIYYLRKKGIPVGIGTSALTVKFFCYQSALFAMCAILWINNSSFISSQLNSGIIFVILGFFFNSSSVIIVFLLAINKRMVNTLLKFIIKTGTKLHLIHKPEKLQEKCQNILSQFSASVSMIRNHPMQLLVQYIFTILQLICIFSIPIVIYHAFGLNSASSSQILALSSLLFLSASYTPLPGASGAQEGGFAFYFNGVFPDATLFSALLIWRFFSYYSTIIIGVLLSLQGIIANKHSQTIEQEIPHEIQNLTLNEAKDFEDSNESNSGKPPI